jgi:succinoglycan biosynthesis transport protein ExoP
MSRASVQIASAALASLDELSSPGLAAAGSFSAAQPEQALLRLDLRRSIEMHRKLVLGFAFFGVLLAAAYLFRHWPIYNAEALVYIQPTPSGVGGVVMHWPYNYDPTTYESYIQQQIVSMTRPDVLRDAAGKIDGWQKDGESEQDAIDRLGRAIEVQRVQSSYQVAITAHGRDAQMAVNMANAMAAAYIDSTRHEQKAGSAEREAMLRDERDRVKKELADDRTEQAQLNAELGVAAVGAAVPEHYDTDIASVHEELVKARADHDEAEARLSALAGNGGNHAALDAQAEEIASADPGLTSLKTALDTRRAALVSQMANLTPNHPLYKQDAAELAKIDANLQKATQELQTKAAARVQQKLQSDLARTAGIEARLNGELGQMTRAAVGATPKLQRAADLAGDIARLQSRYDALDEQLQNQMIEDAAPERAHITTDAVPPLHPAENGVIRNSIVLLFGFSFLGILAAVAAHKLDPRLYIASDVEQVLGFPPMAQLPDFGEVSPAVADEHLLRLSAALEHARRCDHLKNCVLTGTGPGVGATTIATRVRALLEGMGRPAVLVDAMGAGGADGEQPGTSRATRSLALLQRLTQKSMEQGESLVLTDTAPLTLSAQTEYLARNTDCAIVVMESGVTTRAQLRATAHALQRLDVGAVGFVLNRVGLAKANPAFRNSVREVEHHLRAQGRSQTAPDVRTCRVERVADEYAPLRAAIPESADRDVAMPRMEEGEGTAPVQVTSSASLPPVTVTSAALPPDSTQPDDDFPWWLAERPSQIQPNRVPRNPVSQRQIPQPLPVGAGVPLPLSPGPSRPEASVMESRLTGLRNLVSAPAPKPATQSQVDPEANLNVPSPAVRLPQPSAAAPERATPAAGTVAGTLPPGLWAPERLPSCGETLVENPVRREPEMHSHPPTAAQGTDCKPLSAPAPLPATAAPPTPSNGSTRQVTTTPEFLPPRKTRPSRFEPQSNRRERHEEWDDVAILPSWRGQYRRKD